MLKIIIIGLVITVVAIIALTIVDNMVVGEEGTSTSSNISGADKEDLIAVSIEGEVRYSGTYYVDIDAPLEDAIDLAGGPTSNADPRAYNLSYTCQDGMSFYIAPLYDNSNSCSIEPIAKVNINTANKAELMNIPGFGDAVSAALLDYRINVSTFGRIEDIKNVSGIGDATFRKARDYIILKSTN